MKVELEITDITEDNRKDKFQKAIKTLSKEMGIPATIEHKENHKEEFPFKAQEELYHSYKIKFGELMDELYSRICSTLGMRPVSTFRKAIDPNAPKIGKEIIWNPETGKIITDNELDRLLNAIDKFMNRNLGTTKKEFTISQSAVARIIENLKRASSFEEMRDKPLNDLKYKGKKWDYFNNYGQLNDVFPGNYERLKFRERVIGNYITGITEDTRSRIRNVLDQGFLSGKTKSQISQELFDNFGDLNKDWNRIVDTEGVNIFNAEFIDEQKKETKPGEPLYFIRREFGDAKTCSFCIKAVNNKIIAKWSDVPLSDEKIDDPITSIAIWDGKTNYGKSKNDWHWASGPNHPHCRGTWDRYYEEYGDIEL